MKLHPDDIAKLCHEVNRAYCTSIGDDSQVAWDDAPTWQRESAFKGVAFALANLDAPDSAQHDAWTADKVVDGWVYGEVKDAEAKTHPCLVPFDQLSAKQQAKDTLFRAVVRTAADISHPTDPDMQLYVRHLTAGAIEAIRFRFNPSGADRVSKIKLLTGTLLTELEEMEREADAVAPGLDVPPVYEHIRDARTFVKAASMFATLAATTGK